MTKRTLNKQIFFIVAGLLSLLSITVILCVWLATSNHVTTQLENDLKIAEKIFRQTNESTKRQLFNSAEVLAADFGFKQAVASDDSDTIRSVLENHSKRISADIMTLIDLEGEIVSSTSTSFSSKKSIKDKTLINQVLDQGGAISYIQLDKRLYHSILVTIDAPTTIAIAILGFEVNQDLVNDLKKITTLDVTIKSKSDENLAYVSTLEIQQAKDTVEYLSHNANTSFLSIFHKKKYVSRAFTLANGSTEVLVVLSEDLDSLFYGFKVLLFQIILATLVILLMSLFLVAFLSKKLTNPLGILSKKTKLISDDVKHEDICIESNSAEIDTLIKSFNNMVKNIQLREEKISYQANHDLLTGLHNRASFKETVKKSYSENIATTIIVFGVTNFDNVCDTFGYNVGEKYLEELSKRALGISPICARLDTKQISILSYELSPASESYKNEISNLTKEIEKNITIDGNRIDPQTSFCVIHLPKDCLNIDDIFRKINITLKYAEDYPSNIIYFSQEIEDKYLERLNIVGHLQQALAEKQHEFSMVYQPKIHSVNGAISAEALLRWNSSELGFVPPDLFIPLAEQSGLIAKITEFVIASVINQIDSWREVGFTHKVAINLSVRDIEDDNLLNWILKKLAEKGLSADCLSFEIIESELMKDPTSASNKLKQYREAGFNLAIDDFGTGYSSLAYLKFMPINELKIDKSFILKLNEDSHDQNLVKTIIDLAKNFNLEVVAEGIENKESLAMLKALGCEWCQGYFISRPVSAEQYLNWINEKTPIVI